MEFPEVMFYAEAEGLLPTKTGKINAAIKRLIADPRPEIDTEAFEEILNECGLSLTVLSERDIAYIIKKVEG